jgi:hypothetical protein
MATFEEVINRIGVSRAEVKSGQDFNTALEQYVSDASQAFIGLMRADLLENKINSSFELSQSLFPDIRVSSGNIVSEFFSSVDYAELRNEGVSGWETKRDTPFSFKERSPSMKMVHDIGEWLMGKNISGYNEWAVATSVLRHGYDGFDYIGRAFSQENLSMFENDLLNVVSGTIDRIFPKFK